MPTPFGEGWAAMAAMEGNGKANVDELIRRKQEQLTHAKEDAQAMHQFMDLHPSLAKRRRVLAQELDLQVHALQLEIDSLKEATTPRVVSTDEYYDNVARFLNNAAAHK